MNEWTKAERIFEQKQVSLKEPKHAIIIFEQVLIFFEKIKVQVRDKSSRLQCRAYIACDTLAKKDLTTR